METINKDNNIKYLITDPLKKICLSFDENKRFLKLGVIRKKNKNQ